MAIIKARWRRRSVRRSQVRQPLAVKYGSVNDVEPYFDAHGCFGKPN